MSSNCTITIKNRSGLPQQYILFAAPPKISASPKSGVFTNIYMTAPTVPNTTGSARFSVTNNFFAVCGTNKTPLSSKVQVSTLDYKAVVLGTAARSGTTARVRVTDEAPQFDKSTSSPRGHDGAFAIQAGTDFFLPNSTNIFIGLGGESADGDGTIIPLFTFVACPGHTFHLAPVIKYYIGTGSYSEGEIIDIDDIGPSMLVDFTGNNPKNAVLIHRPNGTYSLKSG